MPPSPSASMTERRCCARPSSRPAGTLHAGSLRLGTIGSCPPPRSAHTAVLRGAPGHSCPRSEEHTSELQSHLNLVCRLLLEKKKTTHYHACHFRGVSRHPAASPTTVTVGCPQSAAAPPPRSPPHLPSPSPEANISS